MTVRRDIEDNYEEYLTDELGYAWGVWDRTTLGEMAAHDAILGADADRLNEIDPAGLNDLERLALSRALRRNGDLEGELDALRLIINPPMEHPGVDYVEVTQRIVNRLCVAQLFDEAEMMIQRVESEEWCENPMRYSRGLLKLESDRSLGRKAFENLLEDADDDPEIRFDIAQDMARLGLTDEALAMLDEAKQVSKRTGISAALIDIELLKDQLERGSETTE